MDGLRAGWMGAGWIDELVCGSGFSNIHIFVNIVSPMHILIEFLPVGLMIRSSSSPKGKIVNFYFAKDS